MRLESVDKVNEAVANLRSLSCLLHLLGAPDCSSIPTELLNVFDCTVQQTEKLLTDAIASEKQEDG